MSVSEFFWKQEFEITFPTYDVWAMEKNLIAPRGGNSLGR